MRVQICFILDCTASMQTWIDIAKDRIDDIVRKIQHECSNCSIYVAFIGYRDFHDEEQFIKVDFTEDIESLQNTISTIVAEGGDDACEDVAGAYRFANGLEWFGDIKHVFHITDAPNHGSIYHEEEIEDDYPKGHPYINLKQEVFDLATNDIHLTVFAIKDYTDIMYNIMRNIYTKVAGVARFSIVNLKNTRYRRSSYSNIFYTEVSKKIINKVNSNY